MVDAFIENPLLLLFVVAGLGYGVGSIRIRGSNLGVAAVLFVGLGVGGLSPELHIPDIIIFLGLAMFVYTIGLSSGPSFFATFRQRGSRDIVFVIVMLTLSASIAFGLHFLFSFDASTTSGLYAGSTTNTPALAGLLDAISNANLSSVDSKSMSERAVIGYSLSYPMGVIGVMIAINVMHRLLKIDYLAEERELKQEYPVRQTVTSKTVEITQPDVTGIPLRDLKRKLNANVVFGRLVRGDETLLTNYDTNLQVGDQVALIADEEEIERVTQLLGKNMPFRLSSDRSEYDTRRIFVSNPDIAGERLSTLNLNERFAAIITRVRRGDIDLLANSKLVLELGDRVRFVARRQDIPKISKLFGDSYDALSRINLLSFGLGMALGLLLGMITFQLPGDASFKLGFAGGPIIVALILGALRRTGPIVWTLPYSANLTLRQIGLILLLAGVGVNSGHTFVDTVAQGGGGIIFLAGTIISFITAIATLFIGYKLLKIPFSFLTGMVASQPAVLDFALEKAGNKLPNIGFTLMLPVSLITKIVYVQFLFALLR
ncbi:aspartate:alanine exchanger family transporter [Phaeodactylibacter xiamenensis]|jgi:putative transport protein|uniref:aspartate:alanine exchanger family transporter n=1 Tax=Phaeodactylibacter xiamenensis TaxID=1524460 RepID=UPI0024A89E13|nr:aspartate:alanine exchanger family transporter [Phaeodactylibacter xiamenensis]